MLATMLAATLLVTGSLAAAAVDQNLGPISPFEDRAGLTTALARIVAEEQYCLGIVRQGSNVLLSRSRREPGAPSGIVFPTLIDSTTPGRLRVELEALTHAGLIELATIEGFETYRLTDAGRQFYDVGRRDFCTKGVELIELLGVSERMPELGAAASAAAQPIAVLDADGDEQAPRAYVAYRFRVVQPPKWMHDRGLKRIYPSLGNLDGAVAVALLQEANDGWHVAVASPAAE